MSQPATSSVYTARGPVFGEDWAAVAAAVNERMAARRVGQQELAQLSGVSVSTLRQLQHGAGRRVQNRTLAAVSLGLGWPEGHLAEVLLSGLSDDAGGRRGSMRTDLVQELIARLDTIDQRLATLERLLRGGPPQAN